ncbi:MAG: putative peptidoglycan glycosyltransferase FtsW [Bryobacterales bacterium]|nr:putative lipid II flippase FtsW [Bryobacteraceae bacterium]MDW8356026.1 putative peptidoglycan glycosyltransferase FtsW [Bryobacterales bacterium]
MAQRVKTDGLLFATVLGLTALGLLMLYSASSVVAYEKFGSSAHYLLRQSAWAAVGVMAMMWLKNRSYRELENSAVIFASISVVMAGLLAVLVFDQQAQRRLWIGSVSLQPSEFAKPVLVLFLAWLLTRRAAAINDRYTLMPAAALVGLLSGMVLIADLGTAVVLLTTAGVLFFVAGLEKRYFLLAAGIAFVFLLAATAAKPYRLVRIFGLVDPEFRILETPLVRTLDRGAKLKTWVQRSAASRDPDYHLRQSLIAVGSGGIWGAGLMEGRQKLFYLPEAHTDFVYAVLAEELGLAGSLLVLGAFVVILWRGGRLYWRAPDDFGRYLALGVTTVIVFQALIHISVVLGLTPTKGIPLPMISYGGSSLLSTLICLGVLQSVAERAP